MISYTKKEEEQIKTLFYQYEEKVNKKIEDMKKDLKAYLCDDDVYYHSVHNYLEYNNEHYSQNSNYSIAEYKEKLETLDIKKRVIHYEEQHILDRNKECLSFQEYKQFINEGKKKYNDIIEYQNMRVKENIKIIYDTQRQVIDVQANFERLNEYLEIFKELSEDENFNIIKYGVMELIIYKLKNYYKGLKNIYNEDEIYKFELIEKPHFKNILLNIDDVRINYFNEINLLFEGIDEIYNILNDDENLNEFYKHKFIMTLEHTNNLKNIIIQEITDRIYIFMYKE